MTQPQPPRPETPDLVWTETGQPRSSRFDDVYFSAEDGLAETRAVFLGGCGLPGAWAGRDHFSVAELGFGTGLNIAALLELWTRTGPPDARLSIFSVEAFPMNAADAARALSAWPGLQPFAEALIAGWPPRVPGFHRIELPGFGAELDLAVMDAQVALCEWQGRADAWFLDGFAPAANPDMWSPGLLQLVAARSMAGARVATFTVAGAVRRALADAGFEVERRPGFGRKRERLQATLKGAAQASPKTPRVAVVGSGVAGASMARAFAAQGVKPIVFEAGRPGAGASGNPAALVTPRFDAGDVEVASLYAQAWRRAVALYRDVEGGILAEGVLQLEGQVRDAVRFDRIANQPWWPQEAVTRIGADDAGRRIGEPVGRGGLWLSEALSVDPTAVLGAWLADAESRTVAVSAIEVAAQAVRLLDAQGALLAEVDAVCVCAGAGAADLLPQAPLAPVRGQVSLAPGADIAAAAAWGGYAVPTPLGLMFGATHDRGDASADLRLDDHRRNLEMLASVLPRLAADLDLSDLVGRASVRAVTPDRHPLAGRIEPGVFVLCGLGSRGFCTAPLLAEHVAALMLDRPSPLPRTLAARIDPARRLKG